MCIAATLLRLTRSRLPQYARKRQMGVLTETQATIYSKPRSLEAQPCGELNYQWLRKRDDDPPSILPWLVCLPYITHDVDKTPPGTIFNADFLDNGEVQTPSGSSMDRSRRHLSFQSHSFVVSTCIVLDKVGSENCPRGCFLAYYTVCLLFSLSR